MCNLIILTDSELQLVLTVILILVLLVVLKGIRWLIRKTSIPVHTANAKPDPEPEDRPYPRYCPSFFNAGAGSVCLSPATGDPKGTENKIYFSLPGNRAGNCVSSPQQSRQSFRSCSRHRRFADVDAVKRNHC